MKEYFSINSGVINTPEKSQICVGNILGITAPGLDTISGGINEFFGGSFVFYVVKKNGVIGTDCTHTTVQSAIDDAGSGTFTAIYIRNGTYNEDVRLWGNNKYLIGESRGGVIIDAIRLLPIQFPDLIDRDDPPVMTWKDVAIKNLTITGQLRINNSQDYNKCWRIDFGFTDFLVQNTNILGGYSHYVGNQGVGFYNFGDTCFYDRFKFINNYITNGWSFYMDHSNCAEAGVLRNCLLSGNTITNAEGNAINFTNLNQVLQGNSRTSILYGTNIKNNYISGGTGINVYTGFTSYYIFVSQGSVTKNFVISDNIIEADDIGIKFSSLLQPGQPTTPSMDGFSMRGNIISVPTAQHIVLDPPYTTNILDNNLKV